MSGIISDNKGRSSGLIKAAAGGIPTVAGDKSPATAGDVWYNSSTGKLRAYILVSGWSAGGNLGTARNNMKGGGTASAAWVASGNNPALGTTEEYDGSSWSSGGNTGFDTHGHGAAGLVSAGIKSAGYTTGYQAGSETYNDTSWSSITNLPANKYQAASGGTQTAYITFCGATAPGGSSTSDSTHIWNGSSWSTGGTTNQAGHYNSGCGTTTAGLKVGGIYPTNTRVATVEEYNGTDWTTVTAYPATRYQHTVTGLQTDAMTVGGTSDASSWLATTFTYDGTNWTSGTAYPISLAMAGGARNSASASTSTTIFGGTDYNPSPAAVTNKTYEWSDANTNVTLTTE